MYNSTTRIPNSSSSVRARNKKSGWRYLKTKGAIRDPLVSKLPEKNEYEYKYENKSKHLKGRSVPPVVDGF